MCATDRIATWNFRNKSILVCGMSRSWHQHYRPTASLLLLIFPSVPSQLHPSEHHGDALPGNPTCCRFTEVPVNTRWEPRTQCCRTSNMWLATQLRRGSAKLQTDEIPRITVMSLCSLPINIAVALGAQIAGWLCSIEQTGGLMCMLRRDEYLYMCVCVWRVQNYVAVYKVQHVWHIQDSPLPWTSRIPNACCHTDTGAF